MDGGPSSAPGPLPALRAPRRGRAIAEDVPHRCALSVFFFHARSVISCLREGFRELGYVEGQNIAFEYRSAEEKYERLPELAADLVRSKVDVVLTVWGTPAAIAAKKATTTIPIVFVGVADAVGVGLVNELRARPGGNVTGSTFLSRRRWGNSSSSSKRRCPGSLASRRSPIRPIPPTLRC